MARKLARAHGLGDDDVVISREKLEEWQSHLYVLQAALEDVDRDLATSREPEDMDSALAWLLENCEPLRNFWVEPRTAED